MLPHIPKNAISPKKTLMLQGDWEAGMCNLAFDLQDSGVGVTKVTLSASDWLYKWKGIPTVSYDAPLGKFPEWLTDYVKSHDIDTFILYNQHRPYNAIAWELADKLNVECLTLEMGLLRPDYCSIFTKPLEPYSYFLTNWEEIKTLNLSQHQIKEPIQLERSDSTIKLFQLGFWVVFTRVFMRLGVYKHFQDQRDMSIRHNLVANIKSLYRFYARKSDLKKTGQYWESRKKSYFIAPLQVHCDSQIKSNSSFSSIESFIREVSASFLAHAPKDQHLIFKVHPIDRGYKDYRTLIESINEKLVTPRIEYVDRIHLPSALDYASGCVTINSSVGLSSLIHKTPLKVLGNAVFDLEGLTCRKSLDAYWSAPTPVNLDLLDTFVNTLKHTTQAHGVLYQKLFDLPTHCQINWPTLFHDPLIPERPKDHETTKAILFD